MQKKYFIFFLLNTNRNEVSIFNLFLISFSSKKLLFSIIKRIVFLINYLIVIYLHIQIYQKHF